MAKNGSRLVVGVAILLVLVFISLVLFTGIGYLDKRAETDRTLQANTAAVKGSTELLINCVTPGPNPPPKTGNDCYDRLRTPSTGTADAVAILIVENDCRNRRAKAGLPAPDTTSRCADQTPTSVYPGTP